MSKQYIEYLAYGKFGYMGNIEAEDGNKAIEIVKSKVIGINRIMYICKDDEMEEE